VTLVAAPRPKPASASGYGPGRWRQMDTSHGWHPVFGPHCNGLPVTRSAIFLHARLPLPSPRTLSETWRPRRIGLRAACWSLFIPGRSAAACKEKAVPSVSVAAVCGAVLLRLRKRGAHDWHESIGADGLSTTACGGTLKCRVPFPGLFLQEQADRAAASL
jgi:hypothetical protein